MINTLTPDRRTLLTALFASPFMLSACYGAISQPENGLAAPQAVTVTPHISLTKASLLHDAVLLLLSDDDVDGEWQAALVPLAAGKPYEFSYLYGASYLGSDTKIITDTLEDVRANWPTRKQPAYQELGRYRGDMLERRLQMALGLAGHLTLEKHLFGAMPESAFSSEAAMALDGALLRELLAPIDGLTEAQLTRYFRVLYERTFIAMHTFDPDLGDLPNYLTAYSDWVYSLDDRARQTARSVLAAPPAWLSQKGSFYERNDPLIQRASRARLGLIKARPASTVSADAGDTLYAQALAECYDSFRLILDAARGGVTIEAVTERFSY